MKHAGPDAIRRLSPLLDRIRAVTGGRLKEKAPGVFHFRSRAFLHFHEDPSGLYADLRLPGDADFERLRVSEAEEQGVLLERLSVALAAAVPAAG